jgi:hypothetical protein
MAVRPRRAAPPLRRWAARVGAWPRGTLVAAGVAVAAAATAVWLARDQNAAHLGVVSEVLRATVAALVLWGVCGYPLTRLLTPLELRPHAPLLVAPVGAAASGLALAVLGLLHVPFKVSLAVVLVAGLAGTAFVRLRGGPMSVRGVDPRAGGAVVRLLWPAFVLALVLAVVLIPLFRVGAPTVLGQNGDAVLATETVEFVQKAPPTEHRFDLPADRVPLVWRSKLPIFYSMGATATLSGLTPLGVFAVQATLVLGLAALGWFLFAFYALGAGPWAALAALAAFPLNRMIVYIADHPYYNEAWGMFALPFILTLGLLWLRRPSRRGFALFALFAVLGACAYPLMLLFPAAFLATAALVAWRRARREGTRAPWSRPVRLPRGRRAVLVAVPAIVVAVPVLLVLGRGVGEKLVSGLTILLPGRSLRSWSGTVPYFDVHRFLGLPDPLWLGLALLAAMAALVARALWRAPRDAAIPALVVIVAALLFALQFRLRTFGELFYFKDLGFAAAMIVTVAMVGLADLVGRAARAAPVWRAIAIAGGAGLAVAFVLNDRVELTRTTDQSNAFVRQLASWSRAIPADASVRIDMAPSTYQLWTYYFFSRHPLSSTHPVARFFPHPPLGRRAQYLLVERSRPAQRPPADAAGAPIRANHQFALYRMKPSVPGQDNSSRRMFEPVTSVSVL